MVWEVKLHREFDAEFEALDVKVQNALSEQVRHLEQIGHRLGRPYVDTLKGSRHANMKELRLNAGGGVWRFAFAFDPARQAIILCGGDKSGSGNEKRFYKELIKKADDRLDKHLAHIKSGKTMAVYPSKGWKS